MSRGRHSFSGSGSHGRRDQDSFGVYENIVAEDSPIRSGGSNRTATPPIAGSAGSANLGDGCTRRVPVEIYIDGG